MAREIMQRMIRQFAAEYTSKTSAAQGAPQPNGASDQSLLTTHSHTPAPAPAPAPAATAPATLTSARNPVLSQLLMAEQEAPLDLTVKKPDAIVCEQGEFWVGGGGGVWGPSRARTWCCCILLFKIHCSSTCGCMSAFCTASQLGRTVFKLLTACGFHHWNSFPMTFRLHTVG